jgi:hypothetical protein
MRDILSYSWHTCINMFLVPYCHWTIMKVLDAKRYASDNVKLYTGHQNSDCICPLRCPLLGYLSRKRQDSFTHYIASVLIPHIKGYMTTSDVLVTVTSIWSEQNSFSFEIFRWVYSLFHANFTCISAMLVLLMQHENGVTFTDTVLLVCIGSFTAIRPCVSVFIAGNRHGLIFFSGYFLMCPHYDFIVNISNINEVLGIDFSVPSSWRSSRV